MCCRHIDCEAVCRVRTEMPYIHLTTPAFLSNSAQCALASRQDAGDVFQTINEISLTGRQRERAVCFAVHPGQKGTFWRSPLRVHAVLYPGLKGEILLDVFCCPAWMPDAQGNLERCGPHQPHPLPAPKETTIDRAIVYERFCRASAPSVSNPQSRTRPLPCVYFVNGPNGSQLAGVTTFLTTPPTLPSRNSANHSSFWKMKHRL